MIFAGQQSPVSPWQDVPTTRLPRSQATRSGTSTPSLTLTISVVGLSWPNRQWFRNARQSRRKHLMDHRIRRKRRADLANEADCEWLIDRAGDAVIRDGANMLI